MFSALFRLFETLCLSFYSAGAYRTAADGKGWRLGYLLFVAFILTAMTFWRVIALADAFHEDFTANGAPQMPVMHFDEGGTLTTDRAQPYAVNPAPNAAPALSVIFDGTGKHTPSNLGKESILLTDRAIYLWENDSLSSYLYTDIMLTGRTVAPEDLVSFIDAYIYLLKLLAYGFLTGLNFALLAMSAMLAAAAGGVFNFVLQPRQQPARPEFPRLFRMAALAVTPAFLLAIPAEHYAGLSFPVIPAYLGYMLFALHSTR